MPRTYDVVLSYRNLEVEDFDQLEAILQFIPNLRVWCVDGQTRVRAFQEAMSAVEAVELVVEAIHEGDPSAEPKSVELALVTTSEIASWVGLNREAVRLWTIGRRGPGGFPEPLDVVGDRVKIWSAADVWAWLERNAVKRGLARPLTIAETVDGTRTVERLRRRWKGSPVVIDAAGWRLTKTEETKVPVHRQRRSASA